MGAMEFRLRASIAVLILDGVSQMEVLMVVKERLARFREQFHRNSESALAGRTIPQQGGFR